MPRLKEQQALFADAAAPWEADDRARGTMASVVFAGNPPGPFDYLVPERLLRFVAPGKRVKVPLGAGNRKVEGYCVAVEHRELPSRRLKELAAVVDKDPLLPPALLRLTQWIADYYLCPLGQVLKGVIPAGVRGAAGTREITFLRLPDEVRPRIDELKLPAKQAAVLKHLASFREPQRAKAVTEAVGCTQAPIHGLIDKGLLSVETRRVATGESLPPPTPRDDNLALNDDQQKALDAILAPLEAPRHETILLHGVTGSGKTEVYIQAIERVMSFGRQAIVLVPEISLTPQTQGRFRSRFGDVALLHSHLSDGDRHAQWQRIARGEVGVVVGARSAVFAPCPHLGLIVMDEEHEGSFKQSQAPRYHARDVALQRAKAEGVPLVLGSATPSLESWQAAEEKRGGEGGSGREGAKEKSAGVRECGSVEVIPSLCSTPPPPLSPSPAPPNSTTKADAAAKHCYSLVSLPRRVFNRPLPSVELIDLRTEFLDRDSRGPISRPLKLAMERTLARGEQVILLLNRRGYNTHIQCPKCGEAVRCPQCEIALTYHHRGEFNVKTSGKFALCHQCDYECPAPSECPACKFKGMQFRGLGTQRLEDEVGVLFPQYRALRMDTDSMQKRGAHEKALAAFKNGEVQILLGTQMIAKGLDFPNVTLVGVVNADTALHLPDFRAAERTFQLVTQVAGRGGRGPKGGRVLVQTLNPDHPALQAAAEHDFERFAATELPLRKLLGYPPYGHMFRIVVRGPIATVAREFAGTIAERVRNELGSQSGATGGLPASGSTRANKLPVPPAAGRQEACPTASSIRILGPAPCAFPKLKGLHRFHLQLLGPNVDQLRAAVRLATDDLKSPEKVQWIVDVDAIEMM